MYQALYRKYRPSCFADVVGQERITRTLKNQSASGRLSHAYLFCGTRGTGKTTCARILAKAANCLHPINGDPCNECEACREINDGSSTDVIELDAATYTGVSNIRELREEAVYSPSSLKKRVYVIDEVHMLSESAFNAFLKILEEPPSHVMFVLATTELSKIPATILSRCQRFDFRRIPSEDIAERLMEIAEREGIPLESSGASLIAQMADGAMRNALSLLEQAAGRAEAELNGENVENILGLVSTAPLVAAAELIASGDTAGICSEFARRYAAGADPAGFGERLLGLMRDLLMLSYSPDAELTGAGYSKDDIIPLLNRFTQARLLYSVRTLQNCCRNLQKSPNRRTELEVCLVSLCNPALGGDFAALAARLEELEKAVASGVSIAAAPPPSDKKTEQTAVPAKKPEPRPQQGPPPPPQSEKRAVSSTFRNDLFAILRDRLLMGELAYLKMCEFSLEGNRLIISAPDPAAGDFIGRPILLNKLSEAASSVAGQPIRAGVELAAPKKETNDDAGLDALLQFAEANPEIGEIR